MEDCIFCQIVEGKLPSKKVYEDDRIVAFHDIQPAAPVHVLIIPKNHVSSMNEVEDFSQIADIHRVAVQLAKELGIDQSGYRLVNNCGREGGQIVFHLHYHLLGGAKLGPLNG